MNGEIFVKFLIGLIRVNMFAMIFLSVLVQRLLIGRFLMRKQSELISLSLNQFIWLAGAYQNFLQKIMKKFSTYIAATFIFLSR